MVLHFNIQRIFFFKWIVLDRTGPALAFEEYSDWSDRNAIIEGQKDHYSYNTSSVLVKLEQMYCPVTITPICVSVQTLCLFASDRLNKIGQHPITGAAKVTVLHICQNWELIIAIYHKTKKKYPVKLGSGKDLHKKN